VEYLNPDDIARDRFGDWNSPDAVLQAAQWAAARREQLLAARQGIAFETVLSAPDKLDFLARARDAGYFRRVFFVSTADPRINAARVAGRIIQGGHTVPIEKIVSRYSRSMANLRIIFELADRVYIYDNSPDDEDARLTARIQDSQLRKVYGPLPTWVGDAIADLPRHDDFVDLRVA
jgi:predicted ABC-type ATPase